MNQHTQSSRRAFLKTLGLGAGTLAVPNILRAAPRPHVIVVGGGFAGATAAKYLKHWSADVDVTLIEPKATYYSPILSNLVLNGRRSLKQLGFKYATLANNYGISVIRQAVRSINKSDHTVRLRNGRVLGYDRLILAPGIDFMPVEGLQRNKTLHAWQSGAQIVKLRRQLAAMPAGGTFVMTIPKAPYRCPPGPYERACVVADFLKRKKPGSKIIVLDANPDIIVKRDTFNRMFTRDYAGVLEYIPNADLQAVDSNNQVAITGFGDYQADVLNVIPPQRAGTLIRRSGLMNDATRRWADVNPLSYESTAAPDIHVIGDSQGTGQPKAGHIGNAEAKVCADAVLRMLSGQEPYANPKTNSACYSPVSSNRASWLTAGFAYNPVTGKMEVVPGSAGSSASVTRENYNDMFDWANSLFGDTFS